jgi:hypothetical protein
MILPLPLKTSLNGLGQATLPNQAAETQTTATQAAGLSSFFPQLAARRFTWFS